MQKEINIEEILTYQQRGGRKTAILERKWAIEKYYESPNICKFCNKIIQIRDNESPTQTRQKQFCDLSCAAKFNNIPRKKEKPIKIKEIYNGDESMTIGEILYLKKGNRQSLYSRIRTKARAKIKAYNVPMVCFICGYKDYIEVHHKKSINSFPLDTFIYIVNDLSNLVYLCPNHHYEADKDILILE